MSTMHAMQYGGDRGHVHAARPHIPAAAAGQVRVRVLTCGVCRTDLHIVDGELATPRLPVTPGHQVVGIVESVGKGVTRPAVGSRVGIPWLGGVCGQCAYCSSQRENLCPEALFTGRDIDGGYAEYCVANAAFCFPLPDAFSDEQAAPLLCAGLIGYRAFRMAGAARRIGLYGFGAAAHILAQVARHLGRDVFAFTRPGDEAGQAFARTLGAVWAGGSDAAPPEPLDATILFAPVGALVPAALRATVPGGVVICAGIHMSDIPAMPYALLWEERMLRSVANLTREDATAFLEVAPEVPVRTTVQTYPLEEADRALADLRAGRVTGAAVLRVATAEAESRAA